MGAIFSALLGPLASLLQSIAGPLAAFFVGRSMAKTEDAAAAQVKVAEVVQAEAQAVAAAPQTKAEVLDRLNAPGGI